MKNKLFYTLVFLSVPLLLSAESINKTAAVKNSTGKTVVAESSAKASKGVKGNTVKTANFRPGERNPFLSDEEKKKIEQEKEAEKQRLIAEKEAKEQAEREAKEKARRKQMLCEELKRYPSRIIRKGIQIDGILGKDAIVNGQVVSRGTKIPVQLDNTKVELIDTEEIEVSKLMEECSLDTKKLQVKVVDVTDNSVWFLYKGERFQVMLTLLDDNTKKEETKAEEKE